MKLFNRIFVDMMLLALVGIFSLSTSAKAGQMLVSFNFVVDANHSYHTSLTQLAGGPFYISRIRILTRGKYCHLTANGLQFSQSIHGPVFSAVPESEQGRYVVRSEVAAIDFIFTQTRYNNAECRLELWSDDSSQSPTLDGNLARLATSLSTEAHLLRASLKITQGYESLSIGISELIDYTNYFKDAVKANQSRERLSEILRELRRRTTAFELSFVPIHEQIRNQDIGENWQTYLKALDRIPALSTVLKPRLNWELNQLN